MKLVCFGNPYVKADSLALEVGKELGAEVCNNPEQLLGYDGSITIIDVVKGLKEPRIISLGELKRPKTVTAHDFDLSYYLQLIRELRKIEIRIIGIPVKGDKERIKSDVKKILIKFNTN